MSDLKIFLRNLLRYKGSVALNILFNLLYVLTSAFSVTLIAPFVSVLFAIVPPVEQVPEFALNMDTVLQYVYYYIGRFQMRFGTMNALLLISVFFIAVTLVSNVFRYFAFFFLSTVRSGLLRDIRREFYGHILTLPVESFSGKRKGDILSRINSDVNAVERGVVCSLQGAIMEPLFVTVFVAGLFIISWQLSLMVLLCLPPVMYISGKIGKGLKKRAGRVQSLMGNMLSRVEESITGLRVIKSFNLIDIAQRNFNEENGRYVKESNAMSRRRDLAGPLTEIMLIAAALGIMLFGGWKVMAGDMNADMFILFVLLLIKTISPAKHTVNAYYDIQKGRAALARIYAVLNEPPGETDVEDAVSKTSFEREIRYNDVCFHYGDSEKIVLDHINLCMEKGRTYAFVGASGAGKTTMADLLNRFFDPVSGSIAIDGIDIRNIKRKDLRELIGTVSQFPFVWHDTVAENIGFGRENVTFDEIVAAAKKAYAHDFIMQLPQGYHTVLGDNGMTLSGGQRQRIVIARAILKNAPILVLDEATSALDTESEQLVQKALEELMRGRTSIVIAHRLSTIRHADGIIVFEDGKITETGTHQQLMDKGGSYAKYVSLQAL